MNTTDIRTERAGDRVYVMRGREILGWLDREMPAAVKRRGWAVTERHRWTGRYTVHLAGEEFGTVDSIPEGLMAFVRSEEKQAD